MFLMTLCQDMTVDDAHIKTINNLASGLERQNCDELATVKKRRQQLNERSVTMHLYNINYLHLTSNH